MAETFTVEQQWPELFAQLDAAQRDNVRQTLAAGWHEGFTPTREDVENVTDAIVVTVQVRDKELA